SNSLTIRRVYRRSAPARPADKRDAVNSADSALRTSHRSAPLPSDRRLGLRPASWLRRSTSENRPAASPPPWVFPRGSSSRRKAPTSASAPIQRSHVLGHVTTLRATQTRS